LSLQNELENLNNKNSKNSQDIFNLKNNIKDIDGNKATNKKLQNKIKNEETLLKQLETDYKIVENQINDINGNLHNLNYEKDELIKKCLMKLHSDIKKHHKKVNEDHDKYVKLYTQAREERHVLERKMMNLKNIVYKNYKVRLI